MVIVGKLCPGPNTCPWNRARSVAPAGRIVNGRSGCDPSIQKKISSRPPEYKRDDHLPGRIQKRSVSIRAQSASWRIEFPHVIITLPRLSSPIIGLWSRASRRIWRCVTKKFEFLFHAFEVRVRLGVADT